MEFNATFIVAFVSFIVFSVIMNLILYKPMNKIVSERQNFVDEHYNDANQARLKSQAILMDKDEKLENSKKEAKKLIANKTDEAKIQKAALTTEAQDKANQTIKTAKNELEQSKYDAQTVLSDKVVELAQDISSKILGEHIAVENVDKEAISNILKES